MSSAYGRTKRIARTISHVKPCGPLDATSPSVSRPTKAQTVKKKRSKRPSDFWSLVFSSRASVVVSSTSGIGGDRTRVRRGQQGPDVPGRYDVMAGARSAPKEVEQPELLV